MELHKDIDGYRLSGHAIERMHQRDITVEEALFVLLHPTEIEQADGFGLMRYAATIAGRPISLTVNALTGVIVTVVAPIRKPGTSAFGWFAVGSLTEART
jgi:hypothetical protein